MVRIVSIEGNIASGKSRLIESMRQRYSDAKHIAFVPEPVQEWEGIKDRSGCNMISKFYEDKARYSFAFQMMAYISRVSLLRKAIASGAEVVVTERSVLTDRNIFAGMLYDDGLLEDVEHHIYTRWFDEFSDDIPVAEVVYMRTSPETCAARAAIRGREGETVSLAYLESVHARHERWLLHGQSTPRILTLNANTDIAHTPSMEEEWLSAIDNFIGQGTRKSVEYPVLQPPVITGWLLRFDGASRGNPGHCAAGWALWHDGELVTSGAHYLTPRGTNNYAEYNAMIGGLQDSLERRASPLIVEGDSQLAIKQMTGEYAARDGAMRRLREQAREIADRIGDVTFRYIPRGSNTAADALANYALDTEIRRSTGAG